MSQPCDKHVAASADDSDSDLDSRFPCHNCVEMTYGLEMKTNNISHFGYNLRSAITNCEIMVIDYNKRLRERSPEAGPSLPMVHVLDKDASSSSSVDTATSKEVDIFSEHNEELADYIRQMNYRRSRNSEKQTFGSWLIISYVNGGWDYDTVKNYLLEEFGVTCMRSRNIPEALVTDKKFKAIIKFETSEQLNRVVMSLRKNQIHDNFLFLSFDKLPISYDVSDSDSDGSRSSFLIPVSNEFQF